MDFRNQKGLAVMKLNPHRGRTSTRGMIMTMSNRILSYAILPRNIWPMFFSGVSLNLDRVYTNDMKALSSGCVLHDLSRNI